MQLDPGLRSLASKEYTIDASAWCASSSAAGGTAGGADAAEALQDLAHSWRAVEGLLPSPQSAAALAASRGQLVQLLEDNLRSACWQQLLDILRQRNTASASGAAADDVQERLSTLAVVLSDELCMQLQSIPPQHGAGSQQSPGSALSSQLLLCKAVGEYGAHRLELLLAATGAMEGPSGAGAYRLAANDFHGAAQLCNDAWDCVRPKALGLVGLFGHLQELHLYSSGINARLGSFVRDLPVQLLPPTLQAADLAFVFAPGDHAFASYLLQLQTGSGVDVGISSEVQQLLWVRKESSAFGQLLVQLPALLVDAVELQATDGRLGEVRAQAGLAALWVALAAALAESLDWEQLGARAELLAPAHSDDTEVLALQKRELHRQEVELKAAEDAARECSHELHDKQQLLEQAKWNAQRYAHLPLDLLARRQHEEQVQRLSQDCGRLDRHLGDAQGRVAVCAEVVDSLRQKVQSIERQHRSTAMQALQQHIKALQKAASDACGLLESGAQDGVPGFSRAMGLLSELDARVQPMQGETAARQLLQTVRDLQALHRRAEAMEGQLRQLTRVTLADGDVVCGALLHAARVVTAGLGHLASSVEACRAMLHHAREHGSSCGAVPLELQLAIAQHARMLLQPSFSLPCSADEVTGAAGTLSALLGPAHGPNPAASTPRQGVHTLASAAAAAERDAQSAVAASLLPAVRSFLIRIILAATRYASLADPNNSDLAACWRHMQQQFSAMDSTLPAAGVAATDAVGGAGAASIDLSTADKPTLQGVLEQAARELPCLLESLQLSYVAAVYGYHANPVALAYAAKAQREHLSGAFLGPSFISQQLYTTVRELVTTCLGAAAAGASPAAGPWTSAGATGQDGVGAVVAGDDVHTLSAAVRALERLAAVVVTGDASSFMHAVSGTSNIVGSGAEAAVTAGHAILEGLDSSLRALAGRLVDKAAAAQGSGNEGGRAREKPNSLYAAAVRLQGLTRALLRRLLKAGVDVVRQSFVFNCRARITGELGWRVRHAEMAGACHLTTNK